MRVWLANEVVRVQILGTTLELRPEGGGRADNTDIWWEKW